jgi:hypothetical protein
MTRCAFRLAAASAALAIPVFAADPPKRPSKKYTIEQFLATTAIMGASFLSDGARLLFTCNATGIVNEGWSAIRKFLDRYLKGQAAPAAASGAP